MPSSSRSLRYYVFWLFLALALGYIFARNEYNTQGGILVFLALLLVGFLLIRAMAKAEGSQWFLTLLVIALGLKLTTSLGRMLTNIEVYGGLFDAGRYHRQGLRIAEAIWRLDFSPVLEHLKFGTVFMDLYGAAVHVVVGPTLSGAYLVFGMLAFVGSFFFYRAFCIAFPYGDRHLYAVLVFLMPSLLYWSNGIGKDAVMALYIGLIAYGAARILARQYVKGLLPLILGLLGAMTIRPHMAGILAVALAVALMLGARRMAIRSPIAYILSVGVVAVALWFFVPLGMQHAGLDELSPEAIEGYIERRQGLTDSGGSGFIGPSVTNPAAIPTIVATILFRPFPWEAHNLQAFIQAVDGMLLLALVIWKIRRLGQAIVAAPTHAYLLFILGYTLIFVIGFTSISNFGTLARERAMLLPLFLMLLAFRPAPKGSPASDLRTT